MGEQIKSIPTNYNGYRFRSRLEARWAVFFDTLGVKYEYEPEGFDLGCGIKYLPDFKVKCYGTRGFRGKEHPAQLEEKSFDLWIEVKGHMTDLDALKIQYFSSGEKIICSDIRNIRNFPIISPRSDYDDHERRWECVCGRSIGKVDDPLPDEFYCEALDKNIKTSYPFKNPILVVGQIPEHGNVYELDYNRNDGTNVYFYNYETIDGDWFGAYPAATNDGKFYLFGDDCNYINFDDVPRLVNAYDIARQARFEHGECG